MIISRTARHDPLATSASTRKGRARESQASFILTGTIFYSGARLRQEISPDGGEQTADTRLKDLYPRRF